MKIDEFIASPLSGDCSLLTRLYDFDHNSRANKLGCIWGLSLLDIEPYGGTVLYNPATTPTNSIAFATTCGDDVHFGLVAANHKFSDSSPIVMTVPRAGDTSTETNFIVGECLHEFLRLGCVHGFFHLEKLAYTWKSDLFRQYAEPPSPSDEPIYERFRFEFDLTPWTEIESRLEELNEKYRHILQFHSSRPWWKLW